MISHHVAAFDSEQFSAAYVKGRIVVVRKADGQSCTLSMAESNVFARRVSDYEFDDAERDPVDRACAWHVVHLQKRPWITNRFGIITIHNEPIARDAA